jgi:hypothetical protein
LKGKSTSQLKTSIEKIYNINFFQNENLVLASGNKGHVELWDIRKSQMVKSKELSSEPIVYGSRTFNKDNNILLGLENWKGVILNDKLDIIHEKSLRSKGTPGVVKSIELGNTSSYFGLKDGKVDIVGNLSSSDSQVKNNLLIFNNSLLSNLVRFNQISRLIKKL